MADQRLVDYIRSYMSAGYSASQIETSLVNAGWDRRSIHDAMNESGIQPAVRMPTAPVATGQPVPRAAGAQQPNQQPGQAAQPVPSQRVNLGIIGRFLAVLGSPGKFFMMVKHEKGYETPVKYYLFLMFIQIIIANALLGLSLWLGSAFFDPSLVNPLMGIIGINTAADFLFANVGLVINLVMLFAVAWLLNKVLRGLGGKGELVDTLKGLVYSYTPNVILTLVSLPLVLGMMVMGIDPGMILIVGSITLVVSLVFGVWTLYLSLKSQAVFHDVSMGKVFGALLITGFILYMIITAIMFVFIMTFFSMLGPSIFTLPTI
jgi:hypothetical protein